MRVFLDTNVWLSARFRPGLCADLLEGLVADGAELLIDTGVHGEFARIARHKLGVDGPLLERTLAFFDQHTVMVAAATEPCAKAPDADDGRIVAAALTAGADWFVTGDKALLALREVDGLPVIDSRTAYLRLHHLPDSPQPRKDQGEEG